MQMYFMQILTFFSYILLLLFIYLSFNSDTYFTFTIYFSFFLLIFVLCIVLLFTVFCSMLCCIIIVGDTSPWLMFYCF